MGRAFSFSLFAHAAFILSFLLLSATRQPLPVHQVVRPVRLVTYLEPAIAPRPRAAAVAEPAAAPPPRLARPAPPPEAPAEAPAPAPVAVPRVAIPVPAADRRAARPAPATEQRPALGERLARRLAATAPAPSEIRPVEVAAPRVESLRVPEPAAAAPAAAPAAAGPAVPPGAVQPVGYFPHAWYLALIKEQLFSRWSPPSEFFRSQQPPVALVSFRIHRAGGIDTLALKQGSGSARFDQSALAAVRSLRQVPALPEQYHEETLDVVIRFQNQQ